MQLTVSIANKSYKVMHRQPHCIAIELLFTHAQNEAQMMPEQPNHFGVNYATSTPIKDGGFVGDTRKGGSCNVDELTITPHCNGTHTECVGHIVHNRLSVHQELNDSLMPCTLLSLTSLMASSTSDTYEPALDTGDKVISKACLEEHLANIDDECLNALVIRTLPNTDIKRQTCYNESNYPVFFTNDAITYLNNRGVQHLLVDFPSIDRMYDDGKMSNHHLFWNVEPQARLCSEDTQLQKTITEMVYVDNTVEDGLYLLNLQVAPFALDAAPSRPLLYPIQSI